MDLESVMDDCLPPNVSAALKREFAAGNLPTSEFLQKCVDVGMQACQTRIVDAIRAAAVNVNYELSASALVREIINASGIEPDDARFALAIPAGEDYLCLDSPSQMAMHALMDCLQLSSDYVRGAWLLASVPEEQVQAARSFVQGDSRDASWACREIDDRIKQVVESKNPMIIAALRNRAAAIREVLPGTGRELPAVDIT